MKAYKRWRGTANERKAMLAEINRQCVEFEKAHGVELMARSLWVLHICFGFGEKRLKQFYKEYSKEIAELIEHYELDETDDVWLCTRKLKDAGFDISSWEREGEN